MPRPPTKAQRIADALMTQIADGEPQPGSWLPSERELSEANAVDRSTVRRALRMLQEQGVVRLHEGTGAEVLRTAPVRRDAADVTSQVGNWRGFHISAEQSGKAPYTKTEVSEVPADAATARWLGVPTGTLVIERARIQGIVGESPVQLSTTWIPPNIVERLPILRQVNTGPGGMLSRLEEIGCQLRFEDSVTCRLPLADEQHRLEIDAKQPVLTVWRRCYDQSNRIVEVTHRVIVGDRHELIYRYDKTQ